MRRVAFMVSGLPGSGKSSTSAALGARLRAEVIARSALRSSARAARGDGDDPVTVAYGPTARTQARANSRLLAIAAQRIQQDGVVVLDAVFEPELRLELRRRMTNTGARLVEVECECPPAVLHARLSARRSSSWSLAIERIAQWYRIPPGGELVTVDTSVASPDVLVARILRDRAIETPDKL